LSERGGQLVAAVVPSPIMRLLSLSGLQRVLLTFADEAEALQHL